MNAPNLTREQARVRAALVRDVSYHVQLDVSDDDAEGFRSVTRVTFSATPGASTFLDLTARAVQRVVLNGREVADAATAFRVDLHDLAAHNEVVVEARCAYTRTGVGLHRFVDPVDDQRFLYTQFEPFDANRVFACFDQPDVKAPFSLAVIAPADWEVVSNAPATSRPEPGGAGRWTFATTQPIPPYIASMVAGPYHRVQDRHGAIPLGLYCRRSMADHLDPDEILTITKQGLDHFTAEFQMAYPFDKYDQLFVPEFNFGAMENPGCVTFSERYIFRSRVTQAARLSRANTILHEMAHMWFGDFVTMRWWDDLWLNESFATFAAHTAVAEATRFGEDSWADFAHSMKEWAYQQDQLPSTHPITSDIVDTQTVMANFDGITYAKGASVLKQLHAWVGPEAFWQGMRDYFATHAWGNAELSDFLAALEGPSGRDLAPWSAKWLETAGVETLRARITTDQDDTMREFVVTSHTTTAHPTHRPHRLGIGLYDVRGERLVRRDVVYTDVDGPTTTVDKLRSMPRPDLLLLNDEDLTYAKVRLDERSTRALERYLATIEGSVSRAVAWGALWDATRDAELAARRFAALVAEHAPAEADISVLQTLLGQAQAAADRYGDPTNREALRAALAHVARSGLQRATPGSDRQLVWARALLAARTDSGFGLGLLDGSVEVEGLSMDPDLRWYIVGHLAAMGRIGATLIEAERDRDPTDIGLRGAEAALAARPDADAKRRAWARWQDEDLALHTRRALLRGFWQVEQWDQLHEYATQSWVDRLPAIWESSSSEEALSLSGAIYPTVLVDEAVVSAADRALALDLPALAKRSLSENRDSTRRAIRARAADLA